MIDPRTFKPLAQVMQDTYKTMLERHPQAFDCIVIPAKSSEHDEILAENAPAGALLDRDERSQEFDPPVVARAMLIPDDAPTFVVTESGNFESFHTAPEDIKLLVSIPGLRLYSIIQWRVYLSVDSEDTIERNVYVADIKPVGRTLNTRMVYLCRPLLAEGEIPETGNMPPNSENTKPETGNALNHAGIL